MKANWISSVWFAYNYGRPCDMSRVQEIVRQKKDVPLFPGVISVFEFPPHVPLSIAVPQVKQIVRQSRMWGWCLNLMCPQARLTSWYEACSDQAWAEQFNERITSVVMLTDSCHFWRSASLSRDTCYPPGISQNLSNIFSSYVDAGLTKDVEKKCRVLMPNVCPSHTT